MILIHIIIIIVIIIIITSLSFAPRHAVSHYVRRLT